MIMSNVTLYLQVEIIYMYIYMHIYLYIFIINSFWQLQYTQMILEKIYNFISLSRETTRTQSIILIYIYSMYEIKLYSRHLLPFFTVQRYCKLYK